MQAQKEVVREHGNGGLLAPRPTKSKRARARHREASAREKCSGAPQPAEDDLGGGCRVAGHRLIAGPARWVGPRTDSGRGDQPRRLGRSGRSVRPALIKCDKALNGLKEF